MIPEHVKTAINEALGLLPSTMDSVQARVMLFAIGLQESRFTDRVQRPRKPGGKPGPARGFWQFEEGTEKSRAGVTGVMLHAATAKHAERICELRGVPFEAHAIWAQLEHDDVLAACFARLLLWTDPKPLPALSDTWGAWALYVERTWRPGSPHRSTWAGFHAAARIAADRRRELRAAP